jgi:signal transduction histidine kinase/DNA-binding response OmpR family regulator
MPIRIVIVDDHEPMRRGIRSLLASCQDWSVCGEAADGLEATQLARELRPDVIVMDISMPRMDGIEAARIIRKEVPESEVIIVSQNDPALVSRQAAEVKARACVSKAALSRDLIPSIREVTRYRNGESQYRTRVASQMHDLSWLEGGGTMGGVIGSTDWSQTPLGDPHSWSPALRMMTKFLLANRFPQLLWWGPQFCSLYNDAYVPILGEKHPWAIGRPVQEVWREIWHVLKPLIETPYRGGPATWMEDIPLEINRRGFFEETHFTVAYSPVPDETVAGGIGGVLATVHEITDKVIGERRTNLLRDLGVRSVEPKSAEEACTIAAETFSRYPKDVPFAFFYLLDSNRQARFVCAAGADIHDGKYQKLIDISHQVEPQTWPVAEVLETEEIVLVPELSAKFDGIPQGSWPDPPRAAALVPVRANISHQLAGLLIVGLSSRLQFDEKYHDFLNLVSNQIATSIANARAYEEEKKRAEALAEIDRAKTLFFSNVSHEFRTPLTLMLGPLEDALTIGDGLAPDQRERLEVAHRNSLRLLKLVNTLLDFSRIEAGRIQACYQPTDVAAFTADLASAFRSAIERAGLRLMIKCEPISEPVYVDREMWEKIVLNLISNAFKFTFAGEIEVGLRNANGAIELIVRDTGTGIPPKDLPHLFERFYRVKGVQGRTFEGSGIGLALVQELAKLHGGSVRAESEVNHGSVFMVTVPTGKSHLPADRIGAERTPASPGLNGEAYAQELLGWLPGNSDEVQLTSLLSATATRAAARDGDQTRARILLADDNADMREYLHKLLQDRFEVVVVPDGQSALESARQQQPDLVLADAMMPRLDGFGLLQALRAEDRLKTIPIVLVSARAGEEARIEGLRAGADDYLVKPFSARELLARIESQLSLAGLRRHAAELERQLREKAEAERLAVRESEERFRALVNASSYAVYRMSPDWREMRQLDGRGFISDTPKPRKDWLDEYIHPDDQPLLLGAIREAVRTKSMFELEHRVRRADGTLGWTYSRAVPVMDQQGEIVEWFGAASDVTSRKEVQENYRKLAETLDAEVRLRTRELEKRNAEILSQSEYVRELSWQLLHTQDEQRRHIARELHDSAGQTLAVLGMSLGSLAEHARGQRPEFKQSLEDANELIQQLTKEIRTMSYLLHPPLLDENGLPAALSWYISGLADRSGLDISFNISAEFGRLPGDMELTIFRLIQECLTNIHRHSSSKTAVIQVLRESDRVLVEVRDQGKGIPPEKLAALQTKGSGVGIRGMRERLRQFRGEMIIDSTSAGTAVLVTIPITGKQDDSSRTVRSAESPL